jgi:hypothetical protein
MQLKILRFNTLKSPRELVQTQQTPSKCATALTLSINHVNRANLSTKLSLTVAIFCEVDFLLLHKTQRTHETIFTGNHLMSATVWSPKLHLHVIPAL